MSEVQYIRDNAVYVSWQTRKGLHYVTLALGEDQITDALAEKILSEWLKTNHPNVVEHMRRQHEADQEFKKSLKPPKQ